MDDLHGLTKTTAVLASPIQDTFIPEGRKVSFVSAVKWVREGWQLFKCSPGRLFGMMLFMNFVMVVLSKLPIINVPELIFPLFVGGLMLSCKKLAEGKKIVFSDLFAGFSAGANDLLAAGFLYMLGSLLITYLINLGFPMIQGNLQAYSLHFLPLLAKFLLYLPLAMACFFAPVLITVQKMKAGEAILASFRAVLRNGFAFLVYIVLIIGMLVLVALPFGALSSMLSSVSTGGGSILLVAATVLIVFPMTLAVLSLIFCSVYLAYQEIFFQP